MGVMTPSNARRYLLLYLASVIGISFIHAPAVLGILLLAAIVAAGNQRGRLLKRTLLAILAFNLSVSLGYVVIALWQDRFAPDYLLLINLRVFLQVFLGFWFVARVNLLAALSAWPLAALVATLAISQIKTFERILRDFRLAFESRNLARPRLTDKAHHAAAQAQTLLDKSYAAASDAALAMRSRGAFDE
jgi:cobalt/nickel transport system permease protein